MSIAITVQVPEMLASRLQRFQDQLPEILERGLREFVAEKTTGSQDESQILQILASQPGPEQVLALRPSPELQARTSLLLSRNKDNKLSREEENELERYLMLEHLVRLAKGYALQRLAERRS